MARYNEILVGRHNKLLTKHFSMKGPAPAPQMSGDIQPGFNLWHGIETRALYEWYRYGVLVIQVAVAASQSGARVRNPAGSNRIVIFEKLAGTCPGPAQSLLALETQTTNTDLGNVVVVAPANAWDKRLNVASGVVLSFAAPAAALAQGRSNAIVQAAGTTYDFINEEQNEVILSPGEAIQMRLTTVNQELDATFWWRERFLEESEINA